MTEASPRERLYAIVEQGLCIGCGLCQAIAGKERVAVTRTSNGYLTPLVEGDLDCYAGPEAELALSANAIAEGYDAALAPLSVVFDLEPGTCFTFYADSVDIGEVVDCSAEGALMAIGSFEAPDGDWPGSDALRALRSEECSPFWRPSFT